MARSLEEWQETIKPLLSGINRYNPEIIETLEQYVQYQVDTNTYDFEPNLVLMKLYQFRPARSNVSVAVQIMLKALVVLPKPDFVLLRCVLSQPFLTDPRISAILTLYSVLECCQFKKFWEDLNESKEVAESVNGFEESVRDYICSVINVSYQNMSLPLLSEYLALEGPALTELAVKQGWTVSEDSGTVQIQNQETNIKSKKILAKIEFDSVAGILASAAAR